jgi:hypothetical protein
MADHTGLGKSATAETAARVREIVLHVLGTEEHREDMLSLAQMLAAPQLRDD